MTIEEFNQSLTFADPPAALVSPLRALWLDARGNWKLAHAEVDSLETSQGMAVHAYLHRKEGDDGNAQYWYSRASRPFPSASLAEEWSNLLEELLA